MGGPQDPVHHALSKRPYAEVIMKVPADETERSATFRVGPFVNPADRIME